MSSNHLVPNNLPVPVYATLGITVVLVESLYIFLVWIPVVRTVMIAAIILMHLFIAYSMGLTSFGVLLILLNLICWYPAIYRDFLKIFRHGKKV
jgi:hypothetical protein